MAKAVKLKNNLYLDTRAIVHNKKILSTILFPIGYVYLSVNNTNPGTIFGGTWQQISGYYLYAGTGGTKTSYTGIGTRSHTLTIEQIPSHNHVKNCIGWTASGGFWVGNGGYTTLDFNKDDATTGNRGGGQGHSHNIATYQVYAWKRVS